MAKGAKRASPLAIRVEDRQTWILTDRSTGNDVGGVTYRHSSQGDHYQPWLLVDGRRTEIGIPLPQLGQAAREIEGKVMKARKTDTPSGSGQ